MKRNLVLFSLLVLVGASVASAQVEYRVSTTPTFVIRTGRAEILGSVKLTAVSPTATLTAGTTFDYVYNGIGCDNDTSNGVSLVLTAPFVNAVGNTQITQVANLADGCHVSVQVAGGLSVTNNTSSIQVQGVRGRVDLSSAGVAPGVSITATINVTPSGSSTISIPNTGEVAKSANGLVVDIQDGIVLFCTGPPPVPLPTVNVTEGFPAAFVHHVTSLAGTLAPADARLPNGGATNNTWIHIIVTGIPTGVVLTWPAVVAGVNTSTLAVSAGSLERRTTATATDQIYEFVTISQGTSDTNVETFPIVPVVTLPATLALGTANVQVNLNPPLEASDAVGLAPPPAVNAPYPLATAAHKPRFNDPLTPLAALLTIAPCRTNLLFPWMAFISGASYDTGFAIANTSTDPEGPSPIPVWGTAPQSGTCILNFYPTDDTTLGTAPAKLTAVTVTTPNVPSGATYATNLSNIPAISAADFTGYMIAVCNFQYGHGFAFITNTISTPSALAQGYVALLIPDPLVQTPAGRLPSDGSWGNFESGEGLAQ
jgi:hypothetical protein